MSNSPIYDFEAAEYDAPNEEPHEETSTDPNVSSPNKSMKEATKQMSTEKCQPMFEYLPSEIKLLVFRYLPNVASLRALVHASPHCHQVYRSTRNQSLTTSILRTLASRNFGFETPTRYLLVSLYSNEIPNVFLGDAIRQVYAQNHAKNPGFLVVEQCRASLDIKNSAR